MEHTSLASEKAKYMQELSMYATFTKQLQETSYPHGAESHREMDPGLWLGEPKWHLNGNIFTEGWGRPQNDGPAIRAYTLCYYAKWLGKHHPKRAELYVPALSVISPIKTDLEFTAHHWKDPGFDIWEEVKGMHFYTAMVQRRALIEGAALAEEMGDTGASTFYRQQIPEIENLITSFWDSKHGRVICTMNNVGGLDYKVSGLDTQVILAALHAGNHRDPFFAPEDERILTTAAQLIRGFMRIYPINRERVSKGVAPAIGRYPEDKYDGEGTSSSGQGNPWMLLTAAMAELAYRVKTAWVRQGQFVVTENNIDYLRLAYSDMPPSFVVKEVVVAGMPKFKVTMKMLELYGDKFLERVKKHVKKKDGMNEQWNRLTGEPQGAEDLTWNYAALITAVIARQQASIV